MDGLSANLSRHARRGPRQALPRAYLNRLVKLGLAITQALSCNSNISHTAFASTYYRRART